MPAPCRCAGTLREVYSLTPSGTLETRATIKVAGGSEVTRQVFRRAERWRPRYSWPPLGGFWGSAPPA